MGWTVRIGQGGSIRTQDRVVDVRVTEEFAHQEFVVTITNPTATDRAQAKGRVDAAIIEIKRGSDTLIEGFIEDIEKGPSIIKYIGRSFLVLTGYTTSSLTSDAGVTEAEYDDETGATIIDDLLDTFCYVNDNELVYTDLTFTEVYGGEVKLHGKKVYDIIRNMCIDHSKDLWADATWTGDNVTAKNIHVGTKSRGSVGAPNKTLYGGIHLKSIPTVKYRSSQNVINRIRVNGKGSGKDKVSVVVNDATSQGTYGVIEGAPYNNNMIVDEATATTIGEAIIAAKKDLVEEIHVDLIQYLADLKYGDWVRIVDSYSFVDTTQRIKKITRSYNNQQGESVSIEVGMPFDNYETLIKDLTKGDVDAEPEMTKLGGAFQLTANDPASTYVRHDKGDWYDTTGTFQTHGKGVCTFWTYADNPATGQYKKALIQISNAGTVSYKVGSQESSAGAAEGTTVSADALNTPIGEVILKGKAVGGGGYTVEDVYSSDAAGKSYIYRDVRPIVGSFATGIEGSSPWEVSGAYSQLITVRPIDMQNREITKIADLKGSLNADFSLYGSNSADTDWVEFLQWDHSSEQLVVSRNIDLYDASTISPRLKFRTPVSEGYTGFYVDYSSVDGLLRFRDASAGTSVFTISDAGRLNLWDDLWMTKGKEINFGSPNTAYIYQDAATEDLKFYDTVLDATKTLSELAAGGVPDGGVQGDIIYHDGSNWVRLAAGTGGYVLQTQGAAANPIWSKGLPASPVQGDIIYYNGSNWVRLAPGSSGNYLKTLGAGNNPIWFNIAAGFVTDPLSNNLDCDGNDVNDIGSLDFRTTLTNAYINFDTNDYLRYVCGTNTYEFAINNTNRLTIDTEDINAYERLDMHNYDIINIDDLIFTGSSSYIDLNGGDIQDVQEIRGNTTTPCQLDFRGDGNHRIYYTGTSDNRLGYKTHSAHAFAIGANVIAHIDANGLGMNTGKYIKSVSGDLELRAPSGSKIKFVIG